MQSSESDYVLLRDGRFERQNGADELRSVFRQASRIPQKDKLLVHFHGGLVVFGAAVKKALPGNTITAYITGLAPTQSGVVIITPIPFTSPVTVNIGSSAVTPSYVAQIGVGYYQSNFTVPSGLAPGNYPFTITANGGTSQGGVVLVVGP